MPSPEALELNTPYIQKDEDKHGIALQPTTKSYDNHNFIYSHEGRLVRVMCEFEEPQQRLRKNFIRSTVLFFGSARSMTRAQYEDTLSGLEEKVRAAAGDAAMLAKAQSEVERLKKTEWMCEWMESAETLARLVAQFAEAEQGLISKSFQKMPDYFKLNINEEQSARDVREQCHDLVVTTGGGPGFMEAANRGAASVKGAKTIGMGISLPFEKGLNGYVSDDLAFEFHYFFTRKYWMMYSCRAIIVAPGGFGTLDELFELMTLKQTKKIPNLPVVLFCKDFWKTAINWQAMADYGVISQTEIDSMCFTDSPEEAVEFVKNFYVEVAKDM